MIKFHYISHISHISGCLYFDHHMILSNGNLRSPNNHQIPCIYQVYILSIFYISHWPLSLFYSKSLGNFCVIFLPIRKRSGKFLCKKKPPRKRSGKFLCKKKPPRKRSGKFLCKRTLYVDLDFIEANTYLYVRDLDCFM